MNLKLATPEQLDEIYDHFYKNRNWFPHIRKDYIQRMIDKESVVYEDGVVITFNVYKRKQKIGTCQAVKGDVILHQILNSCPGSGKAHIVLDNFFKIMKAPVWLSVRKENDKAIAFYKKCGMELVGDISWLKGKMPGFVFLKKI